MRGLLLLAVLMVAACSADEASEPTTTEAPTTIAPDCTPADPDMVALIEPSLDAPLENPRQAVDGDLTFIAGEVGEVSGVVFVFESPAMWALSSNTEDVSYLPAYEGDAFDSLAYLEVTTCR